MSTPSLNLQHVPRLNGSNYYDWVFGLQMVLRRMDAWEVTCGEEQKPTDAKEVVTWNKKSTDRLTLIGLTVETSQYTYIRLCKNGPKAYAALAAIYKKPS